MTKQNLIKSIIEDANIHHNISTLGMKLPQAPENAPDYIFWNACGQLVEMFCEDWQDEPINDKGNRNLCVCNSTLEGQTRKADNSNIKNPRNILRNGACREHDLWH